jgi:hypothetical protein
MIVKNLNLFNYFIQYKNENFNIKIITINTNLNSKK